MTATEFTECRDFLKNNGVITSGVVEGNGRRLIVESACVPFDQSEWAGPAKLLSKLRVEADKFNAQVERNLIDENCPTIAAKAFGENLVMWPELSVVYPEFGLEGNS